MMMNDCYSMMINDVATPFAVAVREGMFHNVIR